MKQKNELKRLIRLGDHQQIKKLIEEIIFDEFDGYVEIAEDDFYIEAEGDYYVSSARAVLAPGRENEIELKLDLDRINTWLQMAETDYRATMETERNFTDYYWRTRL